MTNPETYLLGKAVGGLWDTFKKRIPVPYSVFAKNASLQGFPVVGCFQKTPGTWTNVREYPEAERLMYRVHSLYYQFDLTSNVAFAIGYPCSLQPNASIPSYHLLVKLRGILNSYFDNHKIVSDSKTAAPTRALQTLEDGYIGFFRRTEVSGGVLYALLVSLGCAYGAKFEPDVYEYILKVLAFEITNSTLNTTLNSVKLEWWINTASYLLPEPLLQEQYKRDLTEFVEHNTPKNFEDVLQLTHTHLLFILEVH